MTRFWAIVVALALVGVAVDAAVGASLPGRAALTGFAGCALLVYGAKALGKGLVSRPETYYSSSGSTSGGEPADA